MEMARAITSYNMIEVNGITHTDTAHTDTEMHTQNLQTLTAGMGLLGLRAGLCTSAGNASIGAMERLCSAMTFLLFVR